MNHQNRHRLFLSKYILSEPIFSVLQARLQQVKKRDIDSEKKYYPSLLGNIQLCIYVTYARQCKPRFASFLHYFFVFKERSVLNSQYSRAVCIQRVGYDGPHICFRQKLPLKNTFFVVIQLKVVFWWVIRQKSAREAQPFVSLMMFPLGFSFFCG